MSPQKRSPRQLPTMVKADGKPIARLRPDKVTTAVLGPVSRHLIKKQELPSGRDDEVIHPSEVVKKDWCSRQDYYRMTKVEQTDTDKRRDHSSQTEFIFAEGHEIHQKWQTWLWEMGNLQGVFECIACGAKRWMVSPKDCPNCGAWAFRDYDSGPPQFLRYLEVPAKSAEYLIGGHADGMTVVQPKLLEVKSIGPGSIRFLDERLYNRFVTPDKVVDFMGMWKEIRRPFGEHVRQASLYGLLLQESDHPITDIVFIYENKQTQAVKEFTVTVNRKHVEEILDLCLDLVHAIEVERTPRRPSWATGPEGSKCRDCPWRTLCWTQEASSRRERRARRELEGEGVEEQAQEVGVRAVRAPRRRRRNPRAAG